MTWSLICEHLFIVLAASILSIAIGLPLGIWAYVSKTARPAILRAVDLLQTIPSLALLGIIMVFLDPGKLTVIIGITLYSLLPIVRNTCLGLQEVAPGVKEAARGMGMSKPYRVLMVEFPLAFPTVFTGIRIAVVNAIGTAVFAAFVGGGGLGGVITQAIRISDMKLILAATGVLMVIAVVLDLLMGWFETQMHKDRGGSRKMWIPVAAILLAICLLLPYGRGSSGDLMLYDGDYSETQLMHHMVKMLVEDQTETQNVAAVIKDQVEKALPGVTLNIKVEPKKQRVADIQDGNYEVCLTRWGPDYADPMTHLGMWVTDCDNNYGLWSDAAFDAIIADCTTGAYITDATARWNAMYDAEKIVMDQAVIVPLYTKANANMIKTGVEGIEFHPVALNRVYKDTVKG